MSSTWMTWKTLWRSLEVDYGGVTMDGGLGHVLRAADGDQGHTWFRGRSLGFDPSPLPGKPSSLLFF
ncbi:hypothetical protein B296_00004344 [Ensete ventricosum]|uniref:Uncharacterized protein n=1 Tax=Ensete ventricosum TaxID=4639 RepID=A0A426YM66_ENSVE|nr:hypothetical protein B296_00004344 [Ensete ventricosum]